MARAAEVRQGREGHLPPLAKILISQLGRTAAEKRRRITPVECAKRRIPPDKERSVQ
jgi:hypothetical protein